MSSNGSYAGIVRRTGAYVIDYVVVFVAFVILQSFVLLPLRTWMLGSDEWMKAGGFPLEAYTLLTISFYRANCWTTRAAVAFL
jgi:hypothetical protein